jgi:hypothetical protein
MQHGGNPFAFGASAAEAVCIKGDAFCSDQYVFSKRLLSELSCEDLWTLRNSIFDEHGCCFTQRPEADKFDNSDCTEDAFSQLALNGNERDNVSVIKEMERAKFCH